MLDRHPAPDQALIDRFEPTTYNDAYERWLNGIAMTIGHEVRATKCEHIRYQDALLVLTFERWERGIISRQERDVLVARIYG